MKKKPAGKKIDVEDLDDSDEEDGGSVNEPVEGKASDQKMPKIFRDHNMVAWFKKFEHGLHKAL